jgi:hypothetical protein
MANRTFDNVQGLAKKQILLAGKISLSAAAAVSSFSFPGVASVVKSGTGLYTITLQDQYQDLLGISVIIGGNPLVHAGVGAVDVVSAKTIVVQTIDEAGVLDDVAAASVVYITLVLSNSSVNN